MSSCETNNDILILFIFDGHYNHFRPAKEGRFGSESGYAT